MNGLEKSSLDSNYIYFTDLAGNILEKHFHDWSAVSSGPYIDHRETAEERAKNYPKLTDAERKFSDEFRFPISVSKYSCNNKLTAGHESMSWLQKELTAKELARYLQKGYCYSGGVFKPFNQNNPKKGYYKYKPGQAFASKFLSYFHFYSTNVLTLDVDKYECSASIEDIYNSLYYLRPTFMYATSSDSLNGLRCFRMVYVFDRPIYARPIFPVRRKGKKSYIWDEKDDSTARRVANKNYLNLYWEVVENIGYSKFRFTEPIDLMSKVSVQRFNGNGATNFQLAGDFKIYSLDDFDIGEDNNNVPHEPIDNFRTESYIEHILKPRQKALKKEKTAGKRGRKKVEELQKAAKEYCITKGADVDKSEQQSDVYALFDDIGIVLPSNALFESEAYYEELKRYECGTDCVLNRCSQDDDIKNVIELTSDEFLYCQCFDNIYRRSKIRGRIRIGRTDFLNDFPHLSLRELFFKYRAIYHNVWQSHNLDYSTPFDYPSDYRTIYKVLTWNYNPLKDHNTRMKMPCGSGRKDALGRLAKGRKLLTKNITFDNLLFNIMVDAEFLTSNFDQNGNPTEDKISKEEMVSIACSVMCLGDNSKTLMAIGKQMAKHPKTHGVYTTVEDKVAAMCAERHRRSIEYDDEIARYYDPNLKDKENLALMESQGLKVSLRKLRYWKKEKGLSRRKK